MVLALFSTKKVTKYDKKTKTTTKTTNVTNSTETTTTVTESSSDELEADSKNNQNRQKAVMEQMSQAGMILIMSCANAETSGDSSCSEPSQICNDDNFCMMTQVHAMSERRRMLEETTGDYTCFKPPADANTNAS